jgi:hypothetical protein
VDQVWPILISIAVTLAVGCSCGGGSALLGSRCHTPSLNWARLSPSTLLRGQCPPLLTAADPATPVLLLLSVANVGRDDHVAEGLSSTRVLCDGGRAGIFPADDDCADAH